METDEELLVVVVVAPVVSGEDVVVTSAGDVFVLLFSAFEVEVNLDEVEQNEDFVLLHGEEQHEGGGGRQVQHVGEGELDDEDEDVEVEDDLFCTV